MRAEIHHGDVLDLLPKLSGFDACLCDPPYGLEFMGKRWDHGVPGAETWRLVAGAMKPGAHLLAFGGTRTFHRLACAIEDAGFEIRDTLCWMYGQGFPKSHNGFGFEGYGTALKPAWEPVILAMKPCAGTFAENAERYGVAGLNVDGGRVGFASDDDRQEAENKNRHTDFGSGARGRGRAYGSYDADRENWSPTGRWPANVLLTHHPDCGEQCQPECPVRMLDEQSGESVTPESVSRGLHRDPRAYKIWKSDEIIRGVPCYGDFGGASRFFYCGKATTEERDAGLNGGRNMHPTVKPIDLCAYLAKLLLPPKRDTPRRLLVPFAGSGSEIIGALRAGWEEVVGIEREREYCELAEARVSGDAPLLYDVSLVTACGATA